VLFLFKEVVTHSNFFGRLFLKFLSLVYFCFKQIEILLQVLDMINNPHYLYRMTILHAISLLAPVMGSEITCSKLLPVVINAAKDR
jgi:hypothetical protein